MSNKPSLFQTWFKKRGKWNQGVKMITKKKTTINNEKKKNWKIKDQTLITSKTASKNVDDEENKKKSLQTQ